MSYNDSKEGIIEITDESISKVQKIDVFEDDNINRAVQNYSKILLTKAREHSAETEVGAIIEFSRLNDLTDKDFIVGAEDKSKVNLPKCPTPGIVIHNHPSGGTFSPRDVHRFSADENAVALYAIGNNGKCYAIKKTEKFNELWSSLAFKLAKVESPDYKDTIEEIFAEAENYGLKYYEK